MTETEGVMGASADAFISSTETCSSDDINMILNLTFFLQMNCFLALFVFVSLSVRIQVICKC